jgi:hypothetical protein
MAPESATRVVAEAIEGADGDLSRIASLEVVPG